MCGDVEMQRGVDAQGQGDDTGGQDGPSASCIGGVGLPVSGAIVAMPKDPEAHTRLEG